MIIAREMGACGMTKDALSPIHGTVTCFEVFWRVCARTFMCMHFENLRMATRWDDFRLRNVCKHLLHISGIVKYKMSVKILIVRIG